MSGYRAEGVRDHDKFPGTVLTVREALALAFGSDPHDPLNEREVDDTIRRINAENDRQEDGREEWEQTPTEALGVSLIPGQWYDIRLGSKRALRFCQYLRRMPRRDSWRKTDDRSKESFVFAQWGGAAAKGTVSLWRLPNIETVGISEGYRSLTEITSVEPTPALLANVEQKRLADEEYVRRQEEASKLMDAARDALPVTAPEED